MNKTTKPKLYNRFWLMLFVGGGLNTFGNKGLDASEKSSVASWVCLAALLLGLLIALWAWAVGIHKVYEKIRYKKPLWR